MMDSTDFCPRCNHSLNLHNDAGTIRGGQGQMRCYGPADFEPERQFETSGEPHVCGCSYDGPGTNHLYP
jgi:hypothetical protein